MSDRRSDRSSRRSVAPGPSTRRRFLAVTGAASATALAGCTGFLNGGDEEAGPVGLAEFRGSGALVEDRGDLEGPRVADLPDLSGTLTLYLGGGEGGLYLQLIDLFERIYPDFTVDHTIDSSSDLANTIVEENEAGASPADVFLAVDAGSLGYVAESGATADLPSEALDAVPDAFQDSEGRWVGVAGRARAIPYNTEAFDAEDMPEDVSAFAEADRFRDAMGWGPSYGAFQSFVTAMRLDEGDEATREWLGGMLDQGVTTYDDEFRTSNAVAEGEIGAGFANHYYALRVQNSRADAPIDLAFTRNDAGALVNVSGAEVLESSENGELAGNFVRHLLSAEAQEFFATRTFAYPMIPGVPPVGGLPTIDELNPPDIDLTELADVSGTIDLMREVGVL